MRRWVYRRPHVPRRRPFPVLGRHGPMIFWPALREHIKLRAGRRRWAGRARGLHRAPVGTVAVVVVNASSLTHAARRPPRAVAPPRAPQRNPARAIAGLHVTPNAPNPSTGPIFRFRRAIARMREQLRRRLNWKPKVEPEGPQPSPDRVEAPMMGYVTGPGMVRGNIVGGGE